MDSDEEEMASLRSSARYGRGRAPAPTAAKPGASSAAGSDSDGGGDRDAPGSSARRAAGARSGGQRQATALGPAAPAADHEEEEAMSVDEPQAMEALGEMRGFLPMSFGKKQAKSSVGPEVHKSTARKERGNTGAAAPERKGTVQFGPRSVDAATAAGASRRFSRAEEQSLLAAEGAGAAQCEGGEAASARMDVRGDVESEGEELPLPGKEHEALPVSHEARISAHEKIVTAMGLDPKGSRMVTGSMDGCVNFFDFNGMAEDKKSFRSLEPVVGHLVQSLSFGTTGGCVLVVCSDSHARIYDREGSSKPIQSTVKGDMYVRDMSHTKGHTQMLTGGMWHPFHPQVWITSSLDGTMRLWDLNATPVGMDQVLPSVHVLKTLDKRNVCVGGGAGRAGGLHPCCCVFNPSDAKKMVAGCSDGSVQLFFDKARYQKPDRILRTAHTAAVTDVAFLGVGGDNNLMVTRSLDNTMKVWDCRMLSDAKGPIKSVENLPTSHEKAGLCTSPNGRYIVTGTSFHKTAMGTATVRLYDSTKDYAQIRSLDFGAHSPVRFAWPEELNQLVVSTSTGEVVMLYSPFSSKKGALHFVGKSAKTRSAAQLDTVSAGPIFNMTDPGDIQKFYSTGHGNMTRIRRGEARHAQKTVTPARPLGEHGGGAISAQTDSAAFAALVLKSGAQRLHLRSTSGAELDSQKALLSYADKVSKNDSLVDHVYKSSQPEKLLDWSVEVSEGDKRMEEMLQGDFCRKCGQKVCRCVDYSIYGSHGKKQRTA